MLIIMFMMMNVDAVDDVVYDVVVDDVDDVDDAVAGDIDDF